MAQRFFGQEIQVRVEGEVRRPVAFVLEGKEHVISRVLAAWVDYGFGDSLPGRKRWWQRRHRNYYKVRTAGGEVYEIYHDRGASLKSPQFKKWYVTRQLEPEEDDSLSES